MESLLKELEVLYSRLDEVLLPSYADCGTCGECCKRASALKVYPLEIEYIERYVKNDLLIKKFLAFANNAVISIWGNIAGHCPFQEGALCSIYRVRPYHCRIYGHYIHRERSLLDSCVYRRHATRYSRREELPLVKELDRLVEAHGLLNNDF